MDDLARAIELNGIWAKRPIRDLDDLSVTRPTVFKNGCSVLTKVTPPDYVFVLLFFEWEPDAFYFFEPNRDTRQQLRDAHAASR